MAEHASPFVMRVQSIERMTDPRCPDAVVSVVLTMPDEAPVPSFIPGQYIRLRRPGNDEKPAYFAIASAPQERDRYELFIKCTGALAQRICAAQIGDELLVEGPMGRGFDLSPYQGFDVYLIGVGTGIAPLRSVWRALLPQRSAYGKVAIYAGFLTPLHRLLTDELDALSEHGIEVSVTLEIGQDSWDGPIGYVQDQLAKDRPDGRHAVACLSGMSAMVDACRETLQSFGFDERRILTNY